MVERSDGLAPAADASSSGSELDAVWIGADIPRRGADRFVSGRVAYAADEIPADALFVSLVRSPHARARIAGIATDAAARAPGVAAVLTGADVRSCSSPTPTRLPKERFPGPIEIRCLACEEVLYVGQPVVAIAAERQADAEAAGERVAVDYEPLPAVLDAASALAEGAPFARPGWTTNVVARDRIRQGDVEAAFAGADCIVRGRVRFGAGTSAPMEPRCYVATWDENAERLTFRGTLQQPHQTRLMLAQALDLSEAQVRVVAPAAGGTFGLKMVGHPEEVLVALLARRLRRPVAFLESRRECFLASAREQVHDFALAARRDGTLVAFQDAIVADVGTIGAGGGWLMATVTPTVLPTGYDVPNCAVDATLVTTNKPPWQGVRGYGKETANLVMERAVELLARELGIDALEVRRRNLLPKTAFPHRLPSGLNLDSGDYAGALDQLLDLFPHEAWRERGRRADPRDVRVGVGFAFELTPEGASFPGAVPAGVETSTITLDPSGSVRVATSVTSPGSGNETGIAQIVADVFGLAPRQIHVTQGDTDVTPFGGGNTSSRSLMFGGAAALLAARDLRARVAACAATLLQADAEDLAFADGHVRVRSAPERAVPFGRAVSAIYSQAYSLAAGIELPLQVSRSFRSANVRHVPDAFGRISAYPSFPYSAHAAAVEVDAATGQVRVLDYAAVHDCGVIVNPGLVEGQLKGAIAMGIGAALWEELLHDAAGATRSDRFKTYLLPRSPDLPAFRLGHRCTPSPFHPLGMKGAGESGFGGAMSVILNAVADALGPAGAALERVPLRPEVLLPLLQGEFPKGEAPRGEASQGDPPGEAA